MGSFPCECCQQPECVCLTLNDLPEITIAGYTSVSTTLIHWKESGECCWKRTFMPTVTPNWTCTSYTAQTYEWGMTCQTKSYTWLNYLPPVFQGNTQVPCPLPTWFCCPPDVNPVPIGMTQAGYFVKGSVVYFLVYRPSQIEVFLTRKILTCGNTQVCKYVLASKYFYEYRMFRKMYGSNKNYKQATVLLSCFSEDPEYDYDSADEPNADENGWINDVVESCQDVDATWVEDNDPFTNGKFSFDRIRLFDAMPTGDILLNNSNVLYSLPCEVTMSTLCLTQLNQDTQVCIYTPSIPDPNDPTQQFSEAPPCWCNMTETPTATFPDYLANRCNYFVPIGQPRTQFQVYYCDSGGVGIGLEPGGTTCIILSGGCDDTKPPCATFNKECRPPNTPWATWPVNESCWDIDGPGSVFSSFFDCGCTVSGVFYWSAICAPGSCGSCCSSFSMECPECETVNPYKCYAMYIPQEMVRTIEAKELTWECSGVTQHSQCINAPSWTINFPS
jgi:hypothetical protein